MEQYNRYSKLAFESSLAAQRLMRDGRRDSRTLEVIAKLKNRERKYTALKYDVLSSRADQLSVELTKPRIIDELKAGLLTAFAPLCASYIKRAKAGKLSNDWAYSAIRTLLMAGVLE
jgi:hypothetical protein